VNAYGFANGDPVSYGDPFGLCPDSRAQGLGSLQCGIEDIIGAIRSGPGLLLQDLKNSPHKDFVIGLASLPFTLFGGVEEEGVKLTTEAVVHVLEGHFPFGDGAVGKSIFTRGRALWISRAVPMASRLWPKQMATCEGW
jgi:hypothetical protein